MTAMRRCLSPRFSLAFAVAVVAGWFLQEMAAYAQGLPDTGATVCWDSDTVPCLSQDPHEQACDDNVDNDSDGRTDCADSDCNIFDPGTCPNERDTTGSGPAVDCTDGLDNDGDGDTDCADSDCALLAFRFAYDCPVEEKCADGLDNDSDGRTDCVDPDCTAEQLDGNEITCTTGPPCPGQDGSYATGCPAEDRYGARSHAGGDETVTDLCTGLMWQREMADLSGDGIVNISSITPNPPVLIFDRTHSWCEALRYCESLTYAGFSDWRLPNVRELESLADRRGPMDPVFGQEGQKTPFPYYWSSTPSVHNPVDAVIGPLPEGAPTMGGTNTPIDGVGVPGAWIVDLNASATGLVSPAVADYDPAPGIVNMGINFGWACGGNLIRAVRTVLPGDLAAGGGGAGGDGAERGGGAGTCAADNGNVNSDDARDLSDAVYMLAWLFQGGPEPDSFCDTPGPKEADCAVFNGNTNGDGARDLSDVIYLLAWLFQGGPEPVLICGGTPAEICDDLGGDEDGDGLTDCDDPDCAGMGPGPCPAPETDCVGGNCCGNLLDDDQDGKIDCDDSDCTDECAEDCTNGQDDDADGDLDCSDSECTGEPQCETTVIAQSELPRTGVTQCYDENGAPIACANNVDCPGQDGDYLNGCPSAGRFMDNGDDTVTDTCTGLMWQQDTADIPADADDIVEWCDALTYCETLTFATHSDWRLPNVRELHSIVDFSREDPAQPGIIPAIDPVFTALPNGGRPYWGSTSIANSNGDCEWIIFFDTGRLSSVCRPREESLARVRAVRDAP